MDGGDSGCGIGLLRLTSNKLVTFPSQNSIRFLGSCCSIWGMSTMYVCVCLFWTGLWTDFCTEFWTDTGLIALNSRYFAQFVY